MYLYVCLFFLLLLFLFVIFLFSIIYTNYNEEKERSDERKPLVAGDANLTTML